MCEMIIRRKVKDGSGVRLVGAYIPSVHEDRDPGHSLYHKEVIQVCIWGYSKTLMTFSESGGCRK